MRTFTRGGSRRPPELSLTVVCSPCRFSLPATGNPTTTRSAGRRWRATNAAQRVARRGGGALRVWSCGCSSGHEPYGLAIAWECTLAPHFPSVRLEVVATDISEPALAEARAAAVARAPTGRVWPRRAWPSASA